jgi:hypothetical protein
MQRYRDLDGNSGITGYELGADFIRVEFRNANVYLYTYASTGAQDVERMKRLAEAGDGLGAFINAHVRDRYALRER